MLIEESYRIANIALGWTNNAKTSDIKKQASNILEFTEEKAVYRFILSITAICWMSKSAKDTAGTGD
ncbi:hypothetical protein RRG08_029402 [Elysia crispata]|uniref:Uncharacterized protein n=1 Tax=Elysia crispata TaxID=231223 RepID=A0AAE0Z0D4_9GAST|nr:hypothetical protein RRG08_029402 [Elysia crispata]